MTGGKGEDDLTARCTDQSGAGDPRSDRQAVAHRSNPQRNEQEPCNGCTIERETQDKVDRTRDHAFGKGDLRRVYLSRLSVIALSIPQQMPRIGRPLRSPDPRLVDIVPDRDHGAEHGTTDV